MRKEGNGNPRVCAENLMNIIRGECAYERIKGMNARIVDMPAEEAEFEAQEDARWNIETYETRVDAEEINVSAEIGAEGNFSIELEITEAEDEEDDDDDE